MFRQIDHVIIAVPNLDAAVAAYRGLGFTVTPGGRHANGATHNALIAFADGSYLELIAPVASGKPPTDHQQDRWTSPPGLRGFALLTDDTASAAPAVAARGLEVTGPAENGRHRPDGERVAWRFFTVKAGEGAGVPLPFVIEDVTPRGLRVPAGDHTAHALGVTRFNGVEVAVSDVAVAADAYAALLGAAGVPAPAAGGERSRGVRFRLGAQWLDLVPLSELEAAAGSQPGVSAVELGRALTAIDGRSELPLQATGGARIRIAGG